MRLLRGTFLKKVSPQTPLQRLLIQKPASQGFTLWGWAFVLKVFGKESEENPFSKGFSSVAHIIFESLYRQEAMGIYLLYKKRRGEGGEILYNLPLDRLSSGLYNEKVE